MLLLLLSLFSHYGSLNCDRVKFNESLLIGQHQKHLFEVNAFLEDARHKRNEKGGLRLGDYGQETTKDDEFIDYGITNLWWNSTPWIDKTDQANQNLQQTSFLPIPIGHKFPDKVDTTHRFSSYAPVYPPTHHHGLPGYRLYPKYPIRDTYIPKPSLKPDLEYLPPYPSPFNYKTEVSPLVITRPSFPVSNPPFTTEVDIRHKWREFFTGQFPPDHPLYVPTTFNPQAPWTSKRTLGKEDMYQRYYTTKFASRPPFSSEIFPQSQQKLKKPGYPFSKVRSTPVFFLRGSDSSQGSVNPGPTTTLMMQNSENMKIWLREMTKYTPVEQWVSTLTMQTGVTSSYQYTSLPFLQQITNNIAPSTKRNPQISRTFSKPQEWVWNRQLKNGFKNPTRPVFAQGISLPDRPTDVGDYGFQRATATQDNIFREDERRPVQVGAAPKKDKNTRTTMIDGRSAYTPNYAEMNRATPTAAEVIPLRAMKVSKTPGKSGNKLYHNMMKQYNEGYMMVFLLELARLISTKKKMDVQEVIIHAENIINELFQTAQLAWFGQPLTDTTMKLSILLSEAETEVIQGYTSMLYQMFKERKMTMAVDVNAIINYADSLYEDAEGELLFDTIKEFEEYPNITKTSRQLCYNLIENFLKPFRRLHQSEKRQALLDSVNHALKERLPKRRFHEEKEKETTQEDASNRFPRFRTWDRKRRRSNQSFRKNRARQRYQKRIRTHTQDSNRNIYRKENSQQYEKFPKLRKMMRIINPIKKTSVHTPKKEVKILTTDEFFLNLVTRPTKEYVFTGKQEEQTYETNRFFNYHHYTTETERHFQHSLNEGADNERRIKHIDDGRDETKEDDNMKAVILRDRKEFYRKVRERFKESETFKKAQKKKLKEELLRKIVEGSSYSDEEASLKMNLIEALHYENRTFVDDDVATATDSPTPVTSAEGEMKHTAALWSSNEHEMEWKNRDTAKQNKL